MKKRTLKLLLLKKKIDKNKSLKEISTLTKEKKRNLQANNDLKQILNESKIKNGSIINSNEIQFTNNYQNEIQKRVKVSENRDFFLSKEIKENLSKLANLSNQKQVIEDKLSFIKKEIQLEKEKKSEVTKINKGINY